MVFKCEKRYIRYLFYLYRQFGAEGRLLLWEQHESENPCSNTVVLLQKLRPCPRKETTRSDKMPNTKLNYIFYVTVIVLCDVNLS